MTNRQQQLLVGLVLFLLPFLSLLGNLDGAGGNRQTGWQNLGLSEDAVDEIAVADGPQGQRFLYAAVRGQGVFRRVGAGGWQVVSTGLPHGVLGRVSPHRLMADPNDGRRAWVAVRNENGGALYATDNAGDQWYAVSEGLESHLRAIQLLPAAGTAQLWLATRNSLLRQAAGQHWHSLAPWEGNAEVASLMVIPTQPETIYLGAVGRLLRSRDGGASWQALNTGLGNLTVRAIVVDPMRAERLFVGTGNGVYVTNDGGSTWQLFGFQLAGHGVRRLLYLPGAAPGQPATLFAGLDQGGVWQYRLSARDDEDGQPQLQMIGWTALNNGLGVARINALAVTPDQRVLLAGTEAGLFAYALAE
jgi:hypothetical protein